MESEQVGSIEVPSSNFWRDTDYTEWNVSWFCHGSLKQVPESVLNLAPGAFLHILSNSLCVAMQSLDRAQSWVLYIFVREIASKQMTDEMTQNNTY